MGSVPHEVLSDHVADRLSGRRLLGALFLTFEFDAGFFEQEILPVILDAPVSHAEAARLLQLEGALRDVPHGITVFYDWSGLRTTDYPSPRLEFDRFPVRVGTGIYHPKNVLLLTEDLDADEAGHRIRRLIVAATSANLTRRGWWENVEVCHAEEIEESGKTRLKDSLLTLLTRTERLASNPKASEAIKPYRKFLQGAEQEGFKSRGGRLRPHLFVSGGGAGDDLAGFISAHIPRDDRYRLEIISPFFDKDPKRSPIAALNKAIEPVEVRVFLPQELDGSAGCSKELYAHVKQLGRHVKWGVLPGEMLVLGKAAQAGRRSVHAKVYRIFTPHPRREFIFVGSVNLTESAHSGSGGNIESGLLIEVEPSVRPDFWLQPLRRPPGDFHSVASEDEVDEDATLPVQIRYSWRGAEASGLWDGRDPKVQLTVLSTSGPMGPATEWRRREWVQLAPDLTERLARELVSTSIVTIRASDGRESKVLVQEEDMPMKPELARLLPVRDILHYWSLLRPEQRLAFLDSRAEQLDPSELGALMTSIKDTTRVGDDMFGRSAGVFHAFAQIESRVFEALREGRPRQAAALMFGQRFDSMGTVIERVMEAEEESAGREAMTDVERYIVLLCGVQLVGRVRRDAPDFWNEYAQQGTSLEQRLRGRSVLRGSLSDGGGPEMPAFMDWFDRWFLKRAEPGQQL